jgi:hypothetical protein
MRGMNALQRRRYKRAAPEGAATVTLMPEPQGAVTHAK